MVSATKVQQKIGPNVPLPAGVQLAALQLRRLPMVARRRALQALCERVGGAREVRRAR